MSALPASLPVGTGALLNLHLEAEICSTMLIRRFHRAAAWATPLLRNLTVNFRTCFYFHSSPPLNAWISVVFVGLSVGLSCLYMQFPFADEFGNTKSFDSLYFCGTLLFYYCFFVYQQMANERKSYTSSYNPEFIWLFFTFSNANLAQIMTFGIGPTLESHTKLVSHPRSQ